MQIDSELSHFRVTLRKGESTRQVTCSRYIITGLVYNARYFVWKQFKRNDLEEKRFGRIKFSKGIFSTLMSQTLFSFKCYF